MKILHVITDLEVGGAEFMLMRLIQVAKRCSDDEHLVISLTGKGIIGEKLSALGVQVYALNMHGWRDFFSTLTALRHLMQQLAPDLVQTWLYHADFLGGLAAFRCGIRTVVWGVHSTEVPFRRYPVTAVLRLCCALLSYRVPAAIWCVAAKAVQRHISVGYDKHKFVTIPNGFDLQYWTFDSSAPTELRRQLRVGQDAVLIGSVGRYNPDKDYETMLEAFSLVKSKHPQARLVLIGKGLDEGNTLLAAQLAHYGVEREVFLLGPQMDLPKLMSGFDLFCLHSKTEAFPLVLGEAMALEQFCLTTDVGDAAFLLQDNGMVVAPEKPTQLALAIEQAIELSADVRKVKGQRARARIAEHFSLELMYQRVRAMYLDVIRKTT